MTARTGEKAGLTTSESETLSIAVGKADERSERSVSGVIQSSRPTKEILPLWRDFFVEQRTLRARISEEAGLTTSEEIGQRVISAKNNALVF